MDFEWISIMDFGQREHGDKAELEILLEILEAKEKEISNSKAEVFSFSSSGRPRNSDVDLLVYS